VVADAAFTRAFRGAPMANGWWGARVRALDERQGVSSDARAAVWNRMDSAREGHADLEALVPLGGIHEGLPSDHAIRILGSASHREFATRNGGRSRATLRRFVLAVGWRVPLGAAWSVEPQWHGLVPRDTGNWDAPLLDENATLAGQGAAGGAPGPAGTAPRVFPSRPRTAAHENGPWRPHRRAEHRLNVFFARGLESPWETSAQTASPADAPAIAPAEGDPSRAAHARAVDSAHVRVALSWDLDETNARRLFEGGAVQVSMGF
jgi:hypothetical protein